MIVFGRQKDFRSSHPDNQRTLARLLNAAMCPVTVPEEGVVLVCSGSAQIAKLHTTKIKKEEENKRRTDTHTRRIDGWIDDRETACIHCVCWTRSEWKPRPLTMNDSSSFLCVSTSHSIVHSNYFFVFFFLLLLPRYSAANQTILFPFFPNRRTHYPDRDEPAHRHAIGIQLSFCDGSRGSLLLLLYY